MFQNRGEVIIALNAVFQYAIFFVRSFRKGSAREDGPQYLTALLTAIFTLAELLEVDLFNALWEKFPRVCTYCLEKQCSCAFVQKPDRDEAALVHFRAQHNRCPTTVKGCQEMIYRIYGAVNAQYSELEVWMRLVEEIYEVSIELDAGNRESIADELADVFCRALSLCSKLGFDAEIS